MLTLFLRKYLIDENTLIERSMPNEGRIFVKKGQRINSFDKIGECRVLLEEKTARYEGELLRKRGDFVSQGEALSKGKKLLFNFTTKSPYTGYIVKIDKKRRKVVIRKPSNNFELISGVSGVVENIVEGRGVVIKTRALRIKCAAGFGKERGGEVVIVGRYKDRLTQEGVDESHKGRIVVCGHLTREAYSKGKAVGVSGFVCGSMAYGEFKSLSGDGPSVVMLEGYGEIYASPLVFDYLRDVKARFGIARPFEQEFIMPEEGEQRWCIPEKEPFLQLREGHAVQIFVFPNYGLFGTVLSKNEKKGTAKIKVWDKEEKIELPFENFAVVGA